MQWDRSALEIPESIVTQFLDCLEHEEEMATHFLNPKEMDLFRVLDSPGHVLPHLDTRQKYKYHRYWVRTLRYLLGLLLMPRVKNVLDAGCGIGVQSLLFGLMDKNVLGVDINLPRLEIAAKRLRFYREELADVELHVDFKACSLFSLSAKNEFDLIHVREAISHIHPADEFLAQAYEWLTPGGIIVIDDQNGWSPRRQIQLFFHRGLSLYTTVKDPITGQEIPYALERLFSLPRISQMLTRAGFKIVHRECFVGLRRRGPDWLWNSVVRRVNSSLLISSLLGREYIIAGQKK